MNQNRSKKPYYPSSIGSFKAKYPILDSLWHEISKRDTIKDFRKNKKISTSPSFTSTELCDKKTIVKSQSSNNVLSSSISEKPLDSESNVSATLQELVDVNTISKLPTSNINATSKPPKSDINSISQERKPRFQALKRSSTISNCADRKNVLNSVENKSSILSKIQGITRCRTQSTDRRIQRTANPIYSSQTEVKKNCLPKTDIKKTSEKEAKEKDFTCAICLDILYRPRELSCGHLFCLLCLQNYANSCEKYFSCPSCRQVIILPQNGVNGLGRNLELERTSHDLKSKQSALISSAKICVKCHSENRVSECGHCKNGWCFVCGPQHLSDVKNEVQKLKQTFVQSRNQLRCKRDEENLKYRKLEDQVIEVTEQRKDELLQQVRKWRRISINKIIKISEEIDKGFNEVNKENYEKGMVTNEAWNHYKRITNMLNNLKQNEPTLDADSMTLREIDESNNDNNKLNEQIIQQKTPILKRDSGFIYRRMNSYAKHRWGQNICRRPAGLTISPWTGNLYVTASDTCKIQIFDPNGKYINCFGCRDQKEGGFLCPTGITFSLFNDEIYITDKWKHCIHVYDCNGNFLRQMGKNGSGFGEFCSPEGIATDLKGNIYVSDTCNDRVQVLDKEGVYIREFGLISSEVLNCGRVYTKREFSEPVGVAVTPNGDKVCVADSANHRIKVFNGQTGERTLMFGSKGTNKGQFNSPESVLIDTDGYILVGDSGNGRIQIFKPNGQFFRVLGSRGARKGEFGWVSGLAQTKKHEIIAADFKNHSINVF